MTLSKKGSAFDSRSTTTSQASSWALRTDCGVRVTVTPFDFSSSRSLLFWSMKYFHDESADWAIAAYLKIAWTSFGRLSYFFLFIKNSRNSTGWWYDWTIRNLATSAKPSSLSDDGLLNSAPSITPRSRAGTMSGPARIVTATPSSLNRSAERPTVRYFRPFRSSGLWTGRLNQPSGWVGIGLLKNEITSSFRTSWSSSAYIRSPPP